MDIGDLVYVLIGVVWLIYSFLKKGNKKTTSDLSGDLMTEQPVEEYLPSEVVEQVEDPYETVQKEILVLSEDEGRERKRAEEKLEAALSSTSPSPVLLNTLEGLPQKPPRPTRTKKTTLTHSLQKKEKVLPFGEEQEEKVPDFDLRKAVVFYEILKRPEY